jgi:hypothetical protein
VSCHATLVQSTATHNKQLERMMNFFMHQVGQITGFQQPTPYPETPTIQEFGARMFHNINVSTSTVGVINTGNIESVDLAITALRNSGSQDVAEAIRILSQALVDSTDVPSATKNDALQLLDAIATESALPQDRRRPVVAKSLLTQLSGLIGPIATLTDLASKYIPPLVAYFTS